MPPQRSSDTEPGGLDMNHHRNSDPPVKITREVRVEWLIGAMAAILFQGGILWNQNAASFEKQKEIAGDLRAVREKVEKIDVRSVEMKAQIDSLERRVSQLENRVLR